MAWKNAAAIAVTMVTLGAGCTALLGDFSEGSGAQDGSTTEGGTTDGTLGDVVTTADTGPRSDAGGGGSDGGSEGSGCASGVPCTPAACLAGVTACDDSGVSQCVSKGSATNGTVCEGGVCSNGSCTSCAAGAACGDAGACILMTTDCASGSPVCTSAGNAPNGAPCGTDLYCNDGICEACTPGASCVPSGKPCDQGSVSCSGGQIVCTDTGSHASDGTSCGTNQVCDNGVCVGCTAGLGCTPTNPCHDGVTSCATGTSTCSDLATNVPVGTTCGTNEVCNSVGQCVGCTAGASCTPADACHAGTTACSTGAPTCTDTGSQLAPGTSCGSGEVCNSAGQCVACVTNAPCTPANPCHTGTTSCSSGTPVCTDTGSNATDGTSCGAPLACYQGVCQCNFPGIAAYYTFNGDSLDHSGNGNNATASNTAYLAGGTFGKAIDMGNTDSTITVSGPTVLSGARTVCTWLTGNSLTVGKADPIVSVGALFSLDVLAYQSASGESTCTGVPALNLFVEHTQGPNTTCGPTTSVKLNTSGGGFNFACFAYDGADMTIYLDGAETAPYAISLFNWPMSEVSIASNTVGESDFQEAGSGEFDEMSFWSRQLTLAEMNALYNSGNACKVH